MRFANERDIQQPTFNSDELGGPVVRQNLGVRFCLSRIRWRGTGGAGCVLLLWRFVQGVEDIGIDIITYGSGVRSSQSYY